MSNLNDLFEKNKQWAKEIVDGDAKFFERLKEQQTPNYLWIGCSDSRVPPNTILALPPGEIFVHRNIANLVVHSDLNCLSVMQYAVEVLKVEHIIVCGHYGCGGVKAALGSQNYGLIDNWLRHIKDVKRFNDKHLEGLEGEERVNRLCELNVIEQVKNVRDTTIVKDAKQQGATLSVHGLIYDLGTGHLKELDTNA